MPWSMVAERGTVEGDWTVRQRVTFSGIVVGDVVVTRDGHLRLWGHVEGSLVIEVGGKAELHGQVNGDVFNRGGELIVVGQVNGRLHPVAGKTTIDPRARIRDGG